MKSNRFDKKIRWKIALAVFFLTIIVCLTPAYDNVLTRAQKITNADIIVIDPGHGGRDGGASSSDGVMEKDINLAIAFYIKELAEADGWKVIMTREEDISLGENLSKTIRGKKTADLIARREMIRDIDPMVAVSIHLNSFKQDRSVRGAQTFYPAGPGEQAVLDECKKLAEIIQKQLVRGIADGTDRSVLKKRDALMLKNPTVPMAMVECGFLSNPEEALLLTQEEYQRKLARCIYEGILIYSGKEPAEPLRTIDSRG